MGKTKLTKQDKIKIKNMYKSGRYTMYDIGEYLSISRTYVGSILKIMKVPRNNKRVHESKRKYSLNVNYFDKIDTEEKAYFLGLLYADGNNYAKTGMVQIGLQARDVNILRKFRNSLESNGKITFKNVKKKHKKRQNQYIFCFYSKYMSQKLIKLGCIPCKTKVLKFPTFKQVPKKLIRHFLRGMWDGDGSIGIYTDKKGYKKSSSCLVGSVSFCKSIKIYLKKTVDVHCVFQIQGEKKTYARCTINGNQQTLFFLNWLYKDATIYLERKYKKYLEIIKNNKKLNKSHSYSKFRLKSG